MACTLFFFGDLRRGFSSFMQPMVGHGTFDFSRKRLSNQSKSSRGTDSKLQKGSQFSVIHT